MTTPIEELVELIQRRDRLWEALDDDHECRVGVECARLADHIALRDASTAVTNFLQDNDRFWYIPATFFGVLRFRD